MTGTDKQMTQLTNRLLKKLKHEDALSMFHHNDLIMSVIHVISWQALPDGGIHQCCNSTPTVCLALIPVSRHSKFLIMMRHASHTVQSVFHTTFPSHPYKMPFNCKKKTITVQLHRHQFSVPSIKMSYIFYGICQFCLQWDISEKLQLKFHIKCRSHWTNTYQINLATYTIQIHIPNFIDVHPAVWMGNMPGNIITETSFLNAVITQACKECIITQNIHTQHSQ
jgi:hypothetical protein